MKVIQNAAGDLVNEKGQRVAILKSFYAYELETLSLAPGGNSTDSVTIEANSDFVLTKLTYSADIAAAAQTDSSRVIPLVLLQLVDTGSGRQIFNQPVPVPSVCGTGELPSILPVPYKFHKNATLNATFENYDAAATYNLRIALIGYRDYGFVEIN